MNVCTQGVLSELPLILPAAVRLSPPAILAPDSLTHAVITPTRSSSSSWAGGVADVSDGWDRRSAGGDGGGGGSVGHMPRSGSKRTPPRPQQRSAMSVGSGGNGGRHSDEYAYGGNGGGGGYEAVVASPPRIPHLRPTLDVHYNGAARGGGNR
jgi:hypothetical protein